MTGCIGALYETAEDPCSNTYEARLALYRRGSHNVTTLETAEMLRVVGTGPNTIYTYFCDQFSLDPILNYINLPVLRTTATQFRLSGYFCLPQKNSPSQRDGHDGTSNSQQAQPSAENRYTHRFASTHIRISDVCLNCFHSHNHPPHMDP